VIAHELRTPLTAIIGHVEIMTTCSIEEVTLWKRSLGFVSGEVERLSILVEDLLSLSRLDHIPVHTQVINLRLVAEEALSGLYEQAEKDGVTLVLQAPAELPRAQADPDRIRQVFINLLHNSIKYAPGSMVTIRLTDEDGALHVEVCDTGPGIAAEDLPHIFEPLFRSRSAPAGSEGSGLGLAIVRLILDQHNSPVSVASPQGKGVCFRFTLPVASSG
jgi:signal transduction histidine kinase